MVDVSVTFRYDWAECVIKNGGSHFQAVDTGKATAKANSAQTNGNPA